MLATAKLKPRVCKRDYFQARNAIVVCGSVGARAERLLVESVVFGDMGKEETEREPFIKRERTKAYTVTPGLK